MPKPTIWNMSLRVSQTWRTGPILLVDGVKLQLHYLGVHELFQHVKVHINCYLSLCKEEEPNNPVLKPHQMFTCVSDKL